MTYIDEAPTAGNGVNHPLRYRQRNPPRPEHVALSGCRIERVTFEIHVHAGSGSTETVAALENGARNGVREALVGQLAARGNGGYENGGRTYRD